MSGPAKYFRRLTMKMNRTRIWVLAIASWVGSCGAGLSATAFTLQPGTTAEAIGSPYPFGGTVLASSAAPFNTGLLAGTLSSQVLMGDTANPYGGLTFTYELSISASSRDSLSGFSVSSFAGFQTDVSYTNNSVSAVAPSFFSRSSSGDVVRSIWLYQQIGPGEESPVLVIQTDANAYESTMAGVIDGLTANVASFAPSAVPEPASGLLLLAGIGTVLVRGVVKRF